MASSIGYGFPDTVLDVQMDQTTLIANTGFELVAPVDGFLKELRAIVQTAVTTGGTVTISINGGTALSPTLTVANSAAKGTRPTAASFTALSKTARAVVKGDRITVNTSGFASAGALFATLAIEAAAKSNEPGYSA